MPVRCLFLRRQEEACVWKSSGEISLLHAVSRPYLNPNLNLNSRFRLRIRQDYDCEGEWRSLGMLAACCWSMLRKFALKMRLAEMLLAFKMRTE